jgi:predicted metal-binding protein
MHMHREAQEGHVELNIGGYRFQTSVQTLRRVPHIFFDAYFSGRYAQDVCSDGSIFVDRDGEHIGHILEYMRNGVVSVAEDDACPSVSLLRALKREFGFYCIELSTDEPAGPGHPEMVFVMGGRDGDEQTLASMERYDVSLDQWSVAAAMTTGRASFGTCAIAGNVYVTGGRDEHSDLLSSAEMYTPSTDTWSFVSYLPEPRRNHAAVTIGSAMYVLGGEREANGFAVTTSVHKYDSVQDSWSEAAAMPGPRCSFAASAVEKDIYAIGDYTVKNMPSSEQQSLFKYDTETDGWSTLAPMPENEHGISAIELDGLIYIVGAGGGYKLLRFDPASGVWSSLSELLQDRYHCASFVLGGYLYAAGGAADDFDAFSVERYDVAANTWTKVADMLEGRDHFCAVTAGPAGPAEEQNLSDVLIAKASN